ncbi:MAG TPA: sigma-70 family RNA polymerase sigma factor, partial [Polyangiales bacterium]
LSVDPPHERPAQLSFDQLYEQYVGFVWRSLQRLGVQTASLEDATQDVFVVVHRRLSDLRAEASVKAFLYAIALRVAQAYRRKLRRKGAESLDCDTQPASETSPLERVQATRALRVVEAFIASLDEAKRAVFVLSELEQMSAPEIASALELPVNTVYSRLRHAREHFVEYLRERGNPHA